MGKDIHVILERKINEKWEYFDSGFDSYDPRYSDFFEFLNEVSHPGCPEELKNKKLRRFTTMTVDRDGNTEEDFYYDWDTTEESHLFDFGYIRLDELRKAAGRRDVVWVSEAFLETFESLGGKLPEGMFIDPEAETEGSAVAVHVVENEKSCLRQYIFQGIREMEKIAREQRLADSEIRMCFAYDN